MQIVFLIILAQFEKIEEKLQIEKIEGKPKEIEEEIITIVNCKIKDEEETKELNKKQLLQLNFVESIVYEGNANDSESNLLLPTEYEKGPHFKHFVKIESVGDIKKIRANSGINVEMIRYSNDDNNINSPLNKSQII